MDAIAIVYHFAFPDGRKEVFHVRLHPRTLDLLDDAPEDLPAWTALAFHQCAHCPLKPEAHPHCPVAARIAAIVAPFGNVVSHTSVDVRVETPERVVFKRTTAQQGASSLMGLVMATSGCPHTAFFKPMAAYHLPMANVDEMVYRAASMYALAQYYVQRAGGAHDPTMAGLMEIYKAIEKLNVHMARRVRAAIQQDAAVNAIVVLDFFAKNVAFMIDEKLDEFAHLFKMYTAHGERADTEGSDE